MSLVSVPCVNAQIGSPQASSDSETFGVISENEIIAEKKPLLCLDSTYPFHKNLNDTTKIKKTASVRTQHPEGRPKSKAEKGEIPAQTSTTESGQKDSPLTKNFHEDPGQLGSTSPKFQAWLCHCWLPPGSLFKVPVSQGHSWGHLSAPINANPSGNLHLLF